MLHHKQEEINKKEKSWPWDKFCHPAVFFVAVKKREKNALPHLVKKAAENCFFWWKLKRTLKWRESNFFVTSSDKVSSTAPDFYSFPLYMPRTHKPTHKWREFVFPFKIARSPLTKLLTKNYKIFTRSNGDDVLEIHNWLHAAEIRGIAVPTISQFPS